LILTLLLRQLGHDSPRITGIAATNVAFLNHAFERQSGRFHNHMTFERVWNDQIGSEDCQGRALWALGLCVAQAGHGSFQSLAAQLFEQALPVAAEFTAPRAWAFTIIGIHEYLRRLSGDRRANQIRESLTAKLMQCYTTNASERWPWFEDVVSYENAKLPHALILSGRYMNDHKLLQTGLSALRWLVGIQTSEQGALRPIGSNGYYPRGRDRALFDQRPVEAQATVSACIEACQATGDSFWLAESRRAFEWFLGRNDLGLALYDASTGGCRDGLHMDRLSQNQGAESTLAFLIALAEMQALQNTLTSFQEPVCEQLVGATRA
jgi:hypothetical protein